MNGPGGIYTSGTYGKLARTGLPSPLRLSCPLCGSHDPRTYQIVAKVDRGPTVTEGYWVLRCRAHEVEFAEPELTVADGAADQSSLDTLYGSLNDPPLPRYAEFMDCVAVVHPAAGTLHDVGCGNGHLLVEARRRGWKVQGNDLLASVGHPLSARGIPYFVGNLSELGLPPASCDVVSSFCVLPHHVPDPLPDLSAILELLRPGGWFVAELPADGLYRRVAKSVYRLSMGRVQSPLANIYSPRGHMFGYTRRSAIELLRRVGFQAVFVRPYRQSVRDSTARFCARGFLYRSAAFLLTLSLAVAARAVRMPNHMVVFAQAPLNTEAN